MRRAYLDIYIYMYMYIYIYVHIAFARLRVDLWQSKPSIGAFLKSPATQMEKNQGTSFTEASEKKVLEGFWRGGGGHT